MQLKTFRAGMARACIASVITLAGSAATEPVFAHGFAGKRFFPATPTIEDPFVADELSLPTISRRKSAASGDEPATTETQTSAELAKRITSDFGIGIGVTHLRLQPEGGDTQRGFDNLEASVKYQFYKSDAHEAIVSAGMDWDIGGTGAKRVAAESFSTLTPTLFFGKGLGELPEGAKYLRPFAVTGLAGIAIPSRSSTSSVGDDGELTVERHPHVLKTGLAIEYSVPYLQSFVKDAGLRAPFNRLIPLVEIALEKPLDRGRGPTTGTLNPGILWAGRYMQLGLEAVIPVNSATGGKNGILFQVHFFLDDLFPRSIGRPLLGN
jgi:hypothetical protein